LFLTGNVSGDGCGTVLTTVASEFEFNPVYFNNLSLFKNFGVERNARAMLLPSPIPNLEISHDGREDDMMK
jgi:hypothetical protein